MRPECGPRDAGRRTSRGVARVPRGDVSQILNAVPFRSLRNFRKVQLICIFQVASDSCKDTAVYWPCVFSFAEGPAHRFIWIWETIVGGIRLRMPYSVSVRHVVQTEIRREAAL